MEVNDQFPQMSTEDRQFNKKLLQNAANLQGKKIPFQPVVTVLHQSGEISEVSAEAHHTFITVQSKQLATELSQISGKHQQCKSEQRF